MESLIADLRYASRKLLSGPGATLVAILSIGLGVGVSTAIFGIVDQVLISALPYPDPDRAIVLTDRASDGAPLAVTYGTFLEIAQRNRSFEALAVTSRWRPALGTTDAPERLDGDRVSADYFRVLGVDPAVGRGFEAADDVVGTEQVAIVSVHLAARRFGSSEAALGGILTLDDGSYTVIGVMPEAFESVLHPSVEIWAPLRYRAEQPFESREWGHNLGMIGRLRVGVPLEQARREMLALASSAAAEFPRPPWASLEQGLILESLHASVTGDVRPALLAILGAVLMLLAIACANVTNILLARALARRAEFAMRAALGAEPGRLARQLFVESALVAFLGGALGVGIAALATRVLVALAPADLPRVDGIEFDARVFGFAFAMTAIVALVVGFVPALRARDSGISSGLQAERAPRSAASCCAGRSSWPKLRWPRCCSRAPVCCYAAWIDSCRFRRASTLHASRRCKSWLPPSPALVQVRSCRCSSSA